MRKVLTLLALLFFLFIKSPGQSIHNLSFNNIDGDNVNLNTYAGKRIVFVIAPVNPSEGKAVDEIMHFQQQYGSDSIILIGIMSNEDGFSVANKTAIKNLYQSREINIILTEGMYTRKGTNQSGLPHWLTDKSINQKYNGEVQGIGHKFLVSKSGAMIANFNGDFSITDPVISSMLSNN